MIKVYKMSEVPKQHTKHTPPQVFDEIYVKDEDATTYSRVFGGESMAGGAVDQGAAGTEAWPVKISGVEGGALDVTITAPVDVVGPLTNTQLRASAVPVSGPVTNAQLRATPIDMNMVGGNFRHFTNAINRSGKVTTAKAWQQVVPEVANRTNLTIFNVAAEGDLWVTIWTPTTIAGGDGGTYRIAAGGSYLHEASNAIWVTSDTANHPYTCAECLDV